jgi:transposase
MAKLIKITQEELLQAETRRKEAKTVREFRNSLIIILLAEPDTTADKVAKTLGIHRSTVFEELANIRKSANESQEHPQWGGRRREIMTPEEEANYLKTWEEKSDEGLIVTALMIHADLVKKLNFTFPMSTTYRILERNNWRKLKPDTRHPKSDPVIQEEFKKNFRYCWRRLV